MARLEYEDFKALVHTLRVDGADAKGSGADAAAEKLRRSRARRAAAVRVRWHV